MRYAITITNHSLDAKPIVVVRDAKTVSDACLEEARHLEITPRYLDAYTAHRATLDGVSRRGTGKSRFTLDAVRRYTGKPCQPR